MLTCVNYQLRFRVFKVVSFSVHSITAILPERLALIERKKERFIWQLLMTRSRNIEFNTKNIEKHDTSWNIIHNH